MVFSIGHFDCGNALRYGQAMSTGMSSTARVKRISPMLAVADMDETLAFYTTVLGFTVTMRSPEYSIADRDGSTIHFMKAADKSVMAAVRGHASIYIEVDDIRAMYEHAKTCKVPGLMTELRARDYGMAEFHIDDPNDCLVFVGQETP
jgi:predicted enzyme related to lactoylglutathione lyase